MKRSRLCLALALGVATIGARSVRSSGAAFSNPVPLPAVSPRAAVATPAAPQQALDSFLAWDDALKQATVTNGTAEAHFTFNLTNISSANVVISNVQTSCGCTVARLPKQPWVIAPGVHGEIGVTVNLAGKIGTVIKTITVYSDKGTKVLYVRPTILPAPAAGPMTGADRERNRLMAVVDRQAVFKGECAQCHAEPAQGKMGQVLYQSACGVCHESEHRATMVPNLHAIPQETNAAFWRNWIAHGKPGSLMPAFAESEGGILSEPQINSLVAYLTATIPSKPAVQIARPVAPTPN